MKERVERRRAPWLIAGLACLLACQRQPGGGEPAPAPATLGSTSSVESSRAVAVEAVAARPVAELVEPYPGGHWRLADPEQLEHVMVWFRHILIRHAGVPSGLVPLNLAHWWGAPLPAQRSREEAYEIARRIADEAHADPGRFAELAKAHSEDVATRHLGGAVGGLRASAIRPQVLLDVLQALHPGQVSRVVETGYGFHVFLRQSAPEDRSVSGVRIVLAHADAAWVAQYFPRWQVPHRTKREALALADEIYAQLRSDPARFAEMVQRYSDHQDASRAGDFGAWSSREPTPFPREVEVLQRLQPGEIAMPMDSVFGVQIIQRTAERERPALASATIRWRFDPAVPPGSPSAEAIVAEQARVAARELSGHPLAFSEYQQRICCNGRSDWVAGRGEAPIESELARLTPGQVSPNPIRLRNEYLLVQRLEPEPIHATAVDVELPAPEHVDFETAVSVRGLRILRKVLPTLDRLALTPELRSQLRALHDTLPSVRGEPALREFATLQERVGALLGKDRAAYITALRDGLEEWLLRTPRGERLALPTVPADFFASASRPSAPELAAK
jgi:hypothetical protein